jgi:DNA-binding MarR family transcriptional regulator
MPAKITPYFDRPASLGLRTQTLLNCLIDQLDVALEDSGVDLKPTATGAINYLHHAGPSSIANIAESLGYSHQLTSKRVAWLVDLGLARLENDPDDGRRRRVILTGRGEDRADRLMSFLPKLDAAFTELFDEIGVDLRQKVVEAEQSLARHPLDQRIREQETLIPDT